MAIVKSWKFWAAVAAVVVIVVVYRHYNAPATPKDTGGIQ